MTIADFPSTFILGLTIRFTTIYSEGPLFDFGQVNQKLLSWKSKKNSKQDDRWWNVVISYWQ